jgi:hypothetical protein
MARYDGLASDMQHPVTKEKPNGSVPDTWLTLVALNRWTQMNANKEKEQKP